MRGRGIVRRYVTGLIAGLLLCFAASSGVEAAAPAAQTPESITLSPVSKHYELKTGQTIKDTLTIVNDGQTDYTFRVYADPYSVRDENYEPDFSTLRGNTDIENWVTFAQTTYFVKAGQTMTVTYTMTVPPRATPGGHYGVLFAETQPGAPSQESNSVERKKRVGALVYATVDGAFEVGGTLQDLSVSRLQFTPPLRAVTRVANRGTTDFAVATKLTVTDLFGDKKFEAEKTYQVLPDSVRKLSLEWPQAPPIGLFKASVSLNFLGQNHTKAAYVLLAPVWAYLVLVVAVLAVVIYLVQKRR